MSTVIRELTGCLKHLRMGKTVVPAGTPGPRRHGWQTFLTYALNFLFKGSPVGNGLRAVPKPPYRSKVQVTEQYNVAGDLHIVGHQVTPTDRPLQRPPRLPYFTGREAELQRLLADLRPGRSVTLCGPGGIGKTALASEAIWRLAPGNEAPQDFPDGILFHSFYNQPSTDLVLEGIARAFGVEPRPTAEQGARQALGGRTALLVLDGAEDTDDLRKIPEVAGGCGILITSRQVRDAPDKRLDMQPLPDTDALALLRAWCSSRANNQDAARRVCRLVDGLPLAVRLVGRYLDQEGESVVEYLRWLEGYRRLDVERVHLLRLIAACLERREWRAAEGLTRAVEGYLNRQGHWADRLEVNEAGLMASRRLADREGEGQWLTNLGNTYLSRGELD